MNRTMDVLEIREYLMPVIREYVRQEANEKIKELYKEKQTRLQSLSEYLHLLYASQKAGHSVHDEIRQVLEQYKIEAGL